MMFLTSDTCKTKAGAVLHSLPVGSSRSKRVYDYTINQGEALHLLASMWTNSQHALCEALQVHLQGSDHLIRCCRALQKVGRNFKAPLVL